MIRPPAGYPGPARQTTGRPRHGAGAHKVVLRQPKPRPYALSRQVCGSAAHKTAYQAPNRMRSTVSDIPADLRYTAEHEWIHRTGPDTVRVGITDFAQSSLGDVVYVQLPEVGAEVSAGDSFGEVESTKSVSDLYAPMSATVVAVNAELAGEPAADQLRSLRAGLAVGVAGRRRYPRAGPRCPVGRGRLPRHLVLTVRGPSVRPCGFGPNSSGRGVSLLGCLPNGRSQGE